MTRTNSAGPSRGISPAPFSYTPSNFTPLPRSLLSGTGYRISPTPPPELHLNHQSEAGPSNSPRRGSMEPGQIKENVVGADIFIDEIPRISPPPLPDTVESKSKEDQSAQPNDHFQPPGLFTTSMMPSLTSTEGEPSVKLQKAAKGSTSKGKGKAKEDEVDSALLLPSHVLVDSVSPSKKEEMGGDDIEMVEDEDLMEGVHFVDDDISKGSKRYFDPEEDATKEVEATFLATADQSKICQNCKRPGHRSKDCKHIICTTCGAEDSHERRDCPIGLVCFGCGGRGHRKQDCPDPLSRMSRRTGCDRCGSRDHMENTCHTIWRVYAYLSNDSRADTIKDKMSAEGWEKEAIGGRASEEWCYNCAREGHLGDDCSKRRGSLARVTVPSAFSHEMASRGPFFTSSSKRNADLPPPTHSRFNDYDYKDDYDNLPFISGGYQNFGGSSAGKKTREKERSRQMQMSRNEGSDDEPSWFDQSNSGRGGMNIRGRGGFDNNSRGGGYSTPNSRNGIRRPWDSEYREPYSDRDIGGRGRDRDQSISSRSERYQRYQERTRSRSRSPQRPINNTRSNRRDNNRDSMPFSHGHLMDNSLPSSAPSKTISFGKLSEPGSHNNNKNNGAKALINRALGGGGGGNSGQSTPTNKSKNDRNGSPLIKTPIVEVPSSIRSGRKKKSKSDSKDKDWESEWRKDGKGGGKVENWGKDLDKELKDSNGGMKIKGRSGELNSALGGRQNLQNNNGAGGGGGGDRGGGGGGGKGLSRNGSTGGGGGGKGKGKNAGGGGGGGGGGRSGSENRGGGGGSRGGQGGGGSRGGRGGRANSGQRYHGGYD